jgi:hypothetical protein
MEHRCRSRIRAVRVDDVETVHKIYELLVGIGCATYDDRMQVQWLGFEHFIGAITMDSQMLASPALFELEQIFVISRPRHRAEQRISFKRRREGSNK